MLWKSLYTTLQQCFNVSTYSFNNEKTKLHRITFRKFFLNYTTLKAGSELGLVSMGTDI